MNTSIPQNENRNRQVAEHWARVAKKQELGFWNTPGWTEHQNLLASGKPHYSWLQVFRDELSSQGIKPGHALSIGCGCGMLERQMIQEGLCTSAEGCDLSLDLLDYAAEAAKEIQAPITYFKADLNVDYFSPQKFDLIIGAGIFHHIENLEYLFQNLKRALKPGGKLLMYDYVGPSRFQWTPKQIERCNEWLRRLPKKFKKKQGYPIHYQIGKWLFDLLPFIHSTHIERWIQRYCPSYFFAQYVRLKNAQIHMDKLIPPHPSQFLVTDPSEAIRSSDILPILKKHFEIEKLMPLGGTLVQPIFGRTVANFINDAEGTKWAKKILDDERQAIVDGDLSSDFVALIAHR